MSNAFKFNLKATVLIIGNFDCVENVEKIMCTFLIAVWDGDCWAELKHVESITMITVLVAILVSSSVRLKHVERITFLIAILVNSSVRLNRVESIYSFIMFTAMFDQVCG